MATWKQVLTEDSIGSTVQAYDADLNAMAGLTPADGGIIVGTGSSAGDWAVESGATARTSLGAAATGANGDITSLTAVTSIARGAAGTVNLFTDAGANTITIGGASTTFEIAGNLTVSGTTTTINTQDLAVEDNTIILNSGTTGSASQDAGLEIERGDDTNTSFYWDESGDQWAIFSGSIAHNATSTTPTAYMSSFKAVAAGAAPTGDENGIGQLYYDSTDTKLYIRTA